MRTQKKTNNRKQWELERKIDTNTYKGYIKDLHGSAFSLHPRAMIKNTFTNKFREYKMV